jgi:general secretion pathway protein D
MRRWLWIFVAILSSARADAVETGRDMGVEGKRIARLELRSVNVHDALRLISEATGINAVASEEAGRKEIRLSLRDVTVHQAINLLAKTGNLWYREEGGTFRVMTTEAFQKEVVVVREAFTRVFTLLHHNTVEMARVIADLYGSRVLLSLGSEEGDAGAGGGLSRPVSSGGETKLTPGQIERLTAQLTAPVPEIGAPTSVQRGLSENEPPIFVTVVRQHNTLVVRSGDMRVIQDIESLIHELDRPTPQVLLEMKILRLGLGDHFRSIFDFGAVSGSTQVGPPTGQPPNPLVPDAPDSPQRVFGIGNFPLEGGTFIYQFLNDHFRARIQLLEEENKVEVLATPMLLAANNRSARVFVGEERVLVTGVSTNVITSATGPSTTVISPITEVRDIGNTLKIFPRINADRTVTLQITQDTSSVLKGSATLPVSTQTGDVRQVPIDTVDTATLETTVVAKDGLTVAVGGLIQSSNSRNVQKVPFLGDIPILGRLFRREATDAAKQELILLITPHVILTPTEGQTVTETRVKEHSENSFFEREGE